MFNKCQVKKINSYTLSHTSRSYTRDFATGLFSRLIPYKNKRETWHREETIIGLKAQLEINLVLTQDLLFFSDISFRVIEKKERKIPKSIYSTFKTNDTNLSSDPSETVFNQLLLN
jgi:hypothetical protein